MKKNLFFIIFLIVSIFMLTGCINNKKIIEDAKTNNNVTEEKEVENNMEVSIIINGKSYKGILENNATAQAFLELLPQEFAMKELNGNEKYIYIDKSLPVDSSNPKHIETGDIMLYGDNCLVIFYKSFDTSYSYTKIGHIEALPDLGSANVVVKFEK